MRTANKISLLLVLWVIWFASALGFRPDAVALFVAKYGNNTTPIDAYIIIGTITGILLTLFTAVLTFLVPLTSFRPLHVGQLVLLCLLCCSLVVTCPLVFLALLNSANPSPFMYVLLASALLGISLASLVVAFSVAWHWFGARKASTTNAQST